MITGLIHSASTFYNEHRSPILIGALSGIAALSLAILRRQRLNAHLRLVTRSVEVERKRTFESQWVKLLPPSQSRVFAHETDIGNDTDDVFAQVLALNDYGHQMRLVTTTLYHPEDKAKIAALFYKVFGMRVSVSSGYGVYHGEESTWLTQYPCWPQKFGIPGSTNKVSLHQAAAYKKYFSSDFESATIHQRTAVDDIVKLCRKEGQNLILVSLAPLTNLALALEKDPGCMDKINRLVMMGGWFDDAQGGIARLGYNTAVDLAASRKILEQTRFPVLIISSELVKTFTLRDKEREVFLLSPCKTKLGEAACEDMHTYRQHKIPSGGELGLADALTAYIANHPEVIRTSQPVTLTFNPDLLKIDMFDPRSKEVIKLSEPQDGMSNVHIVKGLYEPEQLRMKLVSELLPLFYPNVLPEQFAKLVSLEATPAVIAEQLREINDASKEMAKTIGSFCERVSSHMKVGAAASPASLLQYFEVGKNRVFAVHKKEQDKLNFKEVHAQVLSRLHLPANTPILQIIGDSAPFSAEGVLAAEQFLFPKLNEEDSLVLWGYTGSSKANGRRLDTNALVAKWIEQTGNNGRTIANIVDDHTVVALDKWGALGTSHVKNFFLVFGKAQFGDDIISSDSITDRAICLEGGVQSFTQIVNMLKRDVPVKGIYGLRLAKSPVNFDEATQSYFEYFSATEFLASLFEYIEQQPGKVVTVDQVVKFKEAFLKSRHLFDPRRNDGGTKQALFDAGWKEFVALELWKKKDLCQFTPMNQVRSAL